MSRESWTDRVDRLDAYAREVTVDAPAMTRGEGCPQTAAQKAWAKGRGA